MNRYKVLVSIFVDASTEDEADDIVSDMLKGKEIMSNLWQVDKVIKQWEHEE